MDKIILLTYTIAGLVCVVALWHLSSQHKAYNRRKKYISTNHSAPYKLLSEVIENPGPMVCTQEDMKYPPDAPVHAKAIKCKLRINRHQIGPTVVKEEDMKF